jgi:hypothetical protein
MMTNHCPGWGVEGLSKVIGRRKTDSNIGKNPDKMTNRQTTIHRNLILGNVITYDNMDLNQNR